MYKIAHISDPHLSSEDKNGHYKKFVDFLEDATARGCDHIIITGDISDSPEEKDLSKVRDLLDSFKLLDSDKLTVIPGNHDIFGSPPPGEDSFKFPLICKETDYDYNLQMFRAFFKETFPGPNTVFPFLKILNDSIALIPVNSVARWSLEKNPESTNGEISPDDMERLKMIFSQHDLKNYYKILLVHHHFNEPWLDEKHPYHSMWLKVVNHRMKLHGKEKIIGLLANLGADMVLHGHTHFTEIYKLSGVNFVNSSAGVMPLTSDKARCYHILHIPAGKRQEEGIKIETVTL